MNVCIVLACLRISIKTDNKTLSDTEEKVKRMPDHPLHKRLQDLTKNRLKRTTLNHVLKEQ